nr:unnamed protein product [Callosobruchus analis]
MVYTPDDMLVYGSKGDLVILKDIGNKSLKELVAVKIMRRVHSQRITSLEINPKWKVMGKLLVSTAEDKYVKVWDLETYEIKVSHQQHLKSNRIVTAAFAGVERVVSVSDDGHVIVWNIKNNEMVHMKNLFNAKVTVTQMSVCPHYTKMAVFGLKNGVILVVDLRGSGKIVHQVRAHDSDVISLSWCPIPFNIFPKNPNHKVYITPEQFTAARKEDTGAVVRQTLNDIVSSVEQGGAIPTLSNGPPRASDATAENLRLTSIITTDKDIPCSLGECSAKVTVTTKIAPLKPELDQELTATVSESSTVQIDIDLTLWLYLSELTNFM